MRWESCNSCQRSCRSFKTVRVSREAGDRIGAIVHSLKNFARLDEAEYMEADIHEGRNSTLTLMNAELLERVTVDKRYGEISKIVCNAGQLNRAFLNVLKNAANARAPSMSRPSRKTLRCT